MQLATKKGSGFSIKGSKPFRCSVPCPFSLQQNARHFSHLCSVPLTLVERHGRILADTKILPLIPFEKNFSEHVSDAFPSWFFCSSFGAVLPATQKMNGRVPSEDQHTHNAGCGFGAWVKNAECCCYRIESACPFGVFLLFRITRVVRLV